MTLYPRLIQPAIEQSLYKGKVIVLYGARQVGKTTLIRALQEKYPADSLYLNCDEPDIRSSLSDKTSTELHRLLGSKTPILVDRFRVQMGQRKMAPPAGIPVGISWQPGAPGQPFERARLSIMARLYPLSVTAPPPPATPGTRYSPSDQVNTIRAI
jgi:energy-coupling factor transporter ATP-binding protein EcfA2